jgi:hypothetical protein
MAISFMYFAVNRVFSFTGDHFLIGQYFDHSYIGSWENAPEMYNTLHTIAYLTTTIGWTIGMVVFESEYKRTRHILTLFGIFMITTVFINKSITLFLIWLAFFNNYAIFIGLTRKASKDLHYITGNLLLGFVIYSFGTLLDSRVVKELALISISIPVLLMSMGAFLTIIPFFLKPKAVKTRRAIPGLFISILLIIICNFYMILITIQIIIPYILVYWIILNMLVIYSFIAMYRYIKPPTEKEGLSSIEADDSFIKIFMRPQKVTEEEVSVSKEKRTCLVCKSTVGGNMFMCRDCGAFYCLKCSTTLAGMENACWACEAPFDETRPVNLPEREDGDLEVEATIHEEMKK